MLLLYFNCISFTTRQVILIMKFKSKCHTEIFAFIILSFVYINVYFCIFFEFFLNKIQKSNSKSLYQKQFIIYFIIFYYIKEWLFELCLSGPKGTKILPIDSREIVCMYMWMFAILVPFYSNLKCRSYCKWENSERIPKFHPIKLRIFKELTVLGMLPSLSAIRLIILEIDPILF